MAPFLLSISYFTVIASSSLKSGDVHNLLLYYKGSLIVVIDVLNKMLYPISAVNIPLSGLCSGTLNNPALLSGKTLYQTQKIHEEYKLGVHQYCAWFRFQIQCRHFAFLLLTEPIRTIMYII